MNITQARPQAPAQNPLKTPTGAFQVEPLHYPAQELSKVLGVQIGRSAILVENTVPAGFPSPAEEHMERPLDIAELLGLDRPHNFTARIRSQAMTGKGIDDGDLVVINKKVAPRHGHIVVAVINGELTCRTLYKLRGVVKLEAANPDFADCVVDPGQGLEVWGVVTSVIKKMN